MIKLMATLTYIGIIAFSSNSNASNSRALFDLSPACGYSVQSSRPLDTQSDKCRFFYEDKVNSPAFYGSLRSFKKTEIPRSSFVLFKYVNGRLKSLRENYYDSARDTKQTIIKRRQHPFPKNNNRDTTIITRLQVDYLKESPDFTELESVEEKYDCWDGVAFGRIWAVHYSLCSLVDARSDELFSSARWQYQVIKSLKIQ
jgi:hypothetical protein